MNSSNIQIKNFDFSKFGVGEIEIYFNKKSRNWPIVYILNNNKEVYIGETTNAIMRMGQHLKSEKRMGLEKINIINNTEFNKSATLLIESLLIRYFSAGSNLSPQNQNGGTSHDFHNKDLYLEIFRKKIWPKILKLGLADKRILEIENTDIFKYSPYVSLSQEQYDSVVEILEKLDFGNEKTFVVNGSAGTGKTIIGIYLMKLLAVKKSDIEIEDDDAIDILRKIRKDYGKVGLVIPQLSLRKTLKKVFRKIKGLDSKMVISPIDASKEEYDLFIVDEAHRLKRRVNIVNYAAHDKANRDLKLGKEGTELDWILKNSKHQIFFYDKTQSVKPSDIKHKYFLEKTGIKEDDFFNLKSQFRVFAGNEYIDYVKNILHSKQESKKVFDNYDFKLFENIQDFRSEIQKKESEYSLCRMLSGYGWKWESKKNRDKFDIKIEDQKFIWNQKIEDWVNFSKETFDKEIGCVHTIQGYDLNYAGVIFGPEIVFRDGKIKIIKENYHDRNGKHKGDSDEKLKEYILNIYSVLMTRGIRGTYIYVYDDKLREYMKKYIETYGEIR